jgi:phage terminase small subunit
MGVPKRLTEMQKRFAEFIVFGGPNGPMTQAEAAIAAGYSANSARQEGSSLLNPRLSPLVVQYVGHLKEERLEKHKVTYDTHVAELARIKELALKKNSFSAAVNAETNRGKAGGLYIERKIIKHGKLEDMTEEQLEAKMKQIGA